MSKLYAAALVLGAIAGTSLLVSVGCSTHAQDENIGYAYGAAGEDGGDAGIQNGNLVISAVYPFGGRTGAAFEHDYVEILNRSTRELPLDGLSLQLAASPTSAFTIAVPLTGTLAAGQYFLVELGTASGAADPPGEALQPDQAAADDAPQIGEESTSAVRLAGKIALAFDTKALNCSQLGTSCPAAKIIDLVGWGQSSAFEGAASAGNFDQDGGGPDKRALARPGNSCADTNNNSRDFAIAEPKPRNKSDDKTNCNPPKPEAGVDANSIPKPLEENPLGEETPFDAGAFADGGAPSSASGSSDDSCSVGHVGLGGFGLCSPLVGIALGVMYVLRRRRSTSAR